MTTINTMNTDANATRRHGRIEATCSCCRHDFPIEIMTRTISRKRGGRASLMCPTCAARNLWYHTANEKIMGTAKKNGVLCGIEFETSFSDDKLRNAMFEYGFIPTHDSSLRSDGYGARYGRDRNTCEYVSAIMQGLNRPSKFAQTCEDLMNEGILKVNSSCGTHFHVSINSMKDANGKNTGKGSYMDMVRRFYNSLFIPLCEEMKADRETTERVFGRYFNGYADTIDWNSKQEEHDDRYYFVNCLANNNIEFRINKFVSAKQYQNLMKMEVEMVQCIVRNFCEHFNDTEIDTRRYYRKSSDGSPKLDVNGNRIPSKTEYRKHKADVAAKKLVGIYKKYQ